MRRGVLLFLVCLVLFLGFAVHAVWTLLSLLVVSGRGDALARSELSGTGQIDANKPQMIPKIIHQTYKNESIPLVWQEAQKSCIDLHPEKDGWKYILWTDDMMVNFIREEYSWFAEEFEGYPYGIQRADAIRYFVLSHFGGIYIDLDDGCNRVLEPLLYYPAWVRKTIPTGISNDAMGAVPHHPFFTRVTEELHNYDRSWFLPYITVMGSTGPLFLSVMWRHWTSEGRNVGDDEDGGRIRILFPDEYQGQTWSFFTHHLGDSWHKWDVQLIFWMSRHWILVTILGFLVGGSLLSLSWWIYGRFFLATPSEVPRRRTAPHKLRWRFWRRASERKEYELVNRHEV